MKERKLSFIGDSLHAPPLPSLPFDLVVEILCRLPVKSLLQFRCVCKSWNSLISDSKFAKKHLHSSPPDFTRHHLIVSYLNDSRQFRLKAYPLLSVFDAVPATATHLVYPLKKYKRFIDRIVGSCNGIVCVAIPHNFAIFWNPFTRRFKKSPPLENPEIIGYTVYGFGYDHFADSYKVVATFCCEGGEDGFHQTQVKVHTLGTNCWRRIEGFPSCVPVPAESGKFVNGAVNWLATDNDWYAHTKVIVSLDLANECYQKLLQPDDYGHNGEIGGLTLGVLRDCLCIVSVYDRFCDVWLMKEFGNKESWTKLFSVPNPDKHIFANTLHISEDELLLDDPETICLYNFRDNSFRIPQIQYTQHLMVPDVCVESLISPCF